MGRQRQLFFAAALGPRVRVRILDEPTEGLDPTRRREVLDLMEEDVQEHGTTLLLSSHHLGEVDRVCGRTLFLRRGALLDEAAAEEIHQRAKRALRLQLDRELGADVLARVAEALRAGTGFEVLAGAGGSRLTLFLPPEVDPRASISEVLAVADLPEPTSLVYGELSLHELYRELYGSEGV